MKKFWHSSAARNQRGDLELQRSLHQFGATNFGYDPDDSDWRRRVGGLEIIPEEVTDGDSNLSESTANPAVGDYTSKSYHILSPPAQSQTREQILAKFCEELDKVEDRCTDPDCPYNRWLYDDQPQPSLELLQQWTTGRSNQGYIPSVDDASSIYADLAAYSSPALHTSHLEDLSYPIVTLPKSERKRHETASVASSSLLCCWRGKPDTIFVPIKAFSLSNLKLPDQESGGSNCSCSTTSSCSCSCCWPSEPDDPTAPHAFTVKDGMKKKTTKPSWYRPTCDTACCAVSSFILFCVFGLAALLTYLYFNTNAMSKGMTTN